MKRRLGFTLIEILFVVAIICVMLAVAVTSLTAGRDAARERDDIWSEREVGHEVRVHDVKVERVGARLVGARDVRGQRAVVGGEQ